MTMDNPYRNTSNPDSAFEGQGPRPLAAGLGDPKDETTPPGDADDLDVDEDEDDDDDFEDGDEDDVDVEDVEEETGDTEPE